MIYLNIPIGTTNGWSVRFNERIVKGLEKLGLTDNDVKMYPNYKIIDADNKLFYYLNWYGMESVRWIYNDLNANKKDFHKFIFLDSMQLVPSQIMALSELGYMFDYEVFAHLSKDYSGLVHHPIYYNQVESSFAHIIGNTDHTGVSYFGKKLNWDWRYRSVGGILDYYMPHIKEDIVLWASGSPNNPTKDFATFLEVAMSYPSKSFLLAVHDKDFWVTNRDSHFNIANIEVVYVKDYLEYEKLQKISKYILSTSIVETFGYCIFDGISKGCIPIAPNVGSYRDILPRKFIYDKDDLSTIKFHENAFDYEFNEIVTPFYPENFVKRLIYGGSL